MPRTQTGWRGRAGLALLLTAGTWAALCDVSSAKDREPCRGIPSQETCSQQTSSGEQPANYASGYYYRYLGGPFKGFYPCNAKTPYCGGACYVYGDAPIYSAPADYGHHCAAWCP